MKLLLKTGVSLALLFASTFVIIRYFNLFNLHDIERLLSSIQALPPALLVATIIILLVVDLFIAVPTMTVIIFSGFALGATGGAVSSVIGLTISGSLGYFLSFAFGEKILLRITKKPKEIEEAKALFNANGPILLLLARAAPILPEVTSCLAGMSKMPYLKFLFWYLTSAVPYAVLSAYAGSVSTFDNPKPAIFMGIGITSCLWISWYIFKTKKRNEFIKK